MKKLMFVAALAAAAAAQAACVDPVGPTPTPTVVPAAVYQWKFTGKTGVGVVVKTTEKTAPTGGGCVDVTPGSKTTTSEVIRVPGSLAIVGYTYICDDECNTWAQNLLNPTKAQFYATKPWKSTVAPYRGKNFVTSADIAHVIGKTASQYELAGTAKFVFDNAADLAETFDVTFAGFGSYDKKNGRVSSVAGNFAGTQTPPRYNGKVAGMANCPPADYWTCSPIDYAGAPMDPSVAYGTWSVKYNSAASKKLAGNKTGYWAK